MQTITTAGGVTLEEGVHFYYVELANRMKVPVAILTHTIWEKRKIGRISVESFQLRKNQIHTERKLNVGVKFRYIKDRETGLYFGIVLGVEGNNIVWQQIDMKMQVDIDLSVEDERSLWVIISRSQYVEGSPNQFGKPYYKVTDLQAKALKYLETSEQKYNALKLIKETMNEYQIRDTAIMLNIPNEAYDPVSLRGEILRYVDSTAENLKKFWDYQNNPNKEIIVWLNKAIRKGIVFRKVTQTKEAGTRISYMYGQYTLGVTESEAVLFLTSRENEVVLKNLIVETETAEKQQFGMHNTKIIQADLKTESEEILALRARVAELEKQNADKEVSVKQEIPELSEEKTKSDLSEDELKGIAKALGVRGYALMKKELLIKKIAEAKAEQEIVQT